jgi:hypothetical protein
VKGSSPLEPRSTPPLPLRPEEDAPLRIIRRHHRHGRRRTPLMRSASIATDVTHAEIPVPVVRVVEVELLVHPDPQPTPRAARVARSNQPQGRRPCTLMSAAVPGRLQQPRSRLRPGPTYLRAIHVRACPRPELPATYPAPAFSHRPSRLLTLSTTPNGGIGQNRGRRRHRGGARHPPHLFLSAGLRNTLIAGRCLRRW